MTSSPTKAPLTPRNPYDLRNERGPFDIIGDIHGCADEFCSLLEKLGYTLTFGEMDGVQAVKVTTPPGRRAVFVGDIVDRGPNTPGVLRIVMSMVRKGQAFAVPGNHDVKLVRWLDGRNVKIAHGLEQSVQQLKSEDPNFKERARIFLSRLPIYLWLDGGALVIAHAGIKEDMLGNDSREIRAFCLYGETSGETDEFGLPVRYHWAAEYRGKTSVIYGHTPVPNAEWVNNTICIDTGCCFGGKLTALRWPEKEIVTVPSLGTYAPKRRPFGHPPVRPNLKAGLG